MEPRKLAINDAAPAGPRLAVEDLGMELEGRHVALPGGRRRLWLEPFFWALLPEIVEDEEIELRELFARVGRARRRGQSWASATRVWVLEYYRHLERRANV